MIVAFDVDGTLINFDNTPNYKVIDILRWFKSNGDRIIVWSGGGVDYANSWVRRLGLEVYATMIKSKRLAEQEGVDIAFDDEFVELGKVNIKINHTNLTMSSVASPEREPLRIGDPIEQEDIEEIDEMDDLDEEED